MASHDSKMVGSSILSVAINNFHLCHDETWTDGLRCTDSLQNEIFVATDNSKAPAESPNRVTGDHFPVQIWNLWLALGLPGIRPKIQRQVF